MGFDRVYETSAFLKEDAEPVCPALDREAPIQGLTVPADKGMGGSPQEIGDSPHFLIPQGDTALAVAAVPAHLAVESFHITGLK